MEKLLNFSTPTVEQVLEQLQLEPKITFKGQTRKNNRKRTNGRKTQEVYCFDFSCFPSIKKTKYIKHK